MLVGGLLYSTEAINLVKQKKLLGKIITEMFMSFIFVEAIGTHLCRKIRYYNLNLKTLVI